MGNPAHNYDTLQVNIHHNLTSQNWGDYGTGIETTLASVGIDFHRDSRSNKIVLFTDSTMAEIAKASSDTQQALSGTATGYNSHNTDVRYGGNPNAHAGFSQFQADRLEQIYQVVDGTPVFSEGQRAHLLVDLLRFGHQVATGEIPIRLDDQQLTDTDFLNAYEANTTLDLADPPALDSQNASAVLDADNQTYYNDTLTDPVKTIRTDGGSDNPVERKFYAEELIEKAREISSSDPDLSDKLDAREAYLGSPDIPSGHVSSIIIATMYDIMKATAALDPADVKLVVGYYIDDEISRGPSSGNQPPLADIMKGKAGNVLHQVTKESYATLLGGTNDARLALETDLLESKASLRAIATGLKQNLIADPQNITSGEIELIRDAPRDSAALSQYILENAGASFDRDAYVAMMSQLNNDISVKMKAGIEFDKEAFLNLRARTLLAESILVDANVETAHNDKNIQIMRDWLSHEHSRLFTNDVSEADALQRLAEGSPTSVLGLLDAVERSTADDLSDADAKVYIHAATLRAKMLVDAIDADPSILADIPPDQKAALADALTKLATALQSTSLNDVFDKILSSDTVNDLTAKFAAANPGLSDYGAKQLGLFGGLAFEVLGAAVEVGLIHQRAEKEGWTPDQLELQLDTLKANTFVTTLGFTAGFAVLAAIPGVGAVAATALGIGFGLDGMIGLLSNIKELNENSKPSSEEDGDYQAYMPLVEAALGALTFADDYWLFSANEPINLLLNTVPALKMVGFGGSHEVQQIMEFTLDDDGFSHRVVEPNEIPIGDANAEIAGLDVEDKSDLLVHLGHGILKGQAGDDTLIGYRPELINAGDWLNPSDPDSALAEERQFLEMHGGAGDDWVFKIGGEAALVSGGAGEDWLIGGGSNDVNGETLYTELWGGEAGGTGDGEADDFWVYGGARIMDAEAHDSVAYMGFSLSGGVVLPNQELDYAYWTPGGTALFHLSPVLLMGAAGLLAVPGALVDIVAGLSVRYRVSDSGQLGAEFFAGRGGAVVIDNYDLNLDTGEATGGITVFGLTGPGESERANQNLQQAIDLISAQAFGTSYSGTDPLVLDLDGDGIEVGRYSTYFDMTADGFAERVDWVHGGDGFLAHDLDGNGQIDDITELFGDADTPAFTALATLDDNADGVIDASDTAFGDLRVWVDANHDGVTDAGELQSLADHGITSIDLAASDTEETLRGNAVRAVSTFTRSDGSTGDAADVLLETSLSDTRWLGDDTVSAEAAATLMLKGHGRTRDLDVAMTADAALLTMVEDFAALSGNNWAVYQVQAEGIFLRWTGADEVAATAMGPDFNEAKLAALESWLGQALTPRDANGVPTPTAVTLDQLEETYAEIVDTLTIKLAVQGPMSGVFAAVVYNPQTDRLKLADGAALTGMVAGVLSTLPTDAAAATAEWTGTWVPFFEALFARTDRADGVDLRDDYIAAAMLAAVEQAGGPLDTGPLLDGLGIDTVSIGSAGDDEMTRVDHGLQVMIGGAGDDVLNGSGGQTVFVYGSDWSQDVIHDVEVIDTGDRIRLATLTEADVTLSRDGEDLLILRNGSTDSIRVVKQFGEILRGFDGSIITDDYGIEEIQFADGTIWDFTDIFQAVGRGTSASETITGTTHDDWIEGREGDDVLEGGDGGDVYFYSAGHGSDIIRDIQTDPLASLQDAIVFEAGISFEDFTVSRDGDSDDLVIGFGDGNADTITVEDQFWYGPARGQGGRRCGWPDRRAARLQHPLRDRQPHRGLRLSGWPARLMVGSPAAPHRPDDDQRSRYHLWFWQPRQF